MALSIPLEAARAVGLLPRADTCGGFANYTQCAGNFPTDFCCQTGTTCYAFNSNKGVICCPTKDCSFVSALSCEEQFYNATAFPTSPVHLNNPAAPLTTCPAGNCCPQGYVCANDGCLLSASASATASGTNPPPPITATAAATIATSLSNTVTHGPSSVPTSPPNGGAPATSPTTPVAQSSNPFPTQAILIGLFPGLVGGCLLTFLIIICLGRRKHNRTNSPNNKRNKHSNDSSSSIGPTHAKVSDPIYDDSTATRTDFLRYASRIGRRSPNSTSNGEHTTASSTPIARVRSLFSKTTPTLSPKRWEGSTAPNHPNHPQRGLGLNRSNTDPTTPIDDEPTDAGGTRTPRLAKAPSMESIKIYSTPEATRQTRFGDLLRGPDAPPALPTLPAHMPFMGSPGLVDPRKRGVDGGLLR